jgi:hypothetical protein
MLDECTLSNSLVVGVHHISKERLLIELASRSMVIPSIDIASATRSASCHLYGAAAAGAHVAKYLNVPGKSGLALITLPGGGVEESPESVVADGEQEPESVPFGEYAARCPVDGKFPRHQVGAWVVSEGGKNGMGKFGG